MPNQTNVPQYQLGRCVSLLRLPPIPKVSQLLQTYLPVKKKRVDRVNASSYALSRWTPYILDIMEVSSNILVVFLSNFFTTYYSM